jgi:DNA polymerase/3'-5' exonuclease PolX
MQRIDALHLIQPYLNALRPLCERIEIAGSIRRLKEQVKDAEIVCLPKDPAQFVRFIQTQVAFNGWSWANYGEPGHYTKRTGPKHFGLNQNGFTVEIFTANKINFGFIHWLRTGSGEANEYVMRWLSWKDAPYRPRDGYFWHGEKKLILNTEAQLFALLGLPIIAPQNRNPQTYEQLLKNHQGYGDPIYAPEPAPQPQQLSLF